MLTKKRGQVTIFIILGIIIVISIIIMLTFRSGDVQEAVKSKLPQSQSFETQVKSIENMVSDCLSRTLDNGVFELSDIELSEYEDELNAYINNHIFECIDFSPFTTVEITALNSLEKVQVILANDRTFVSADMEYSIKVEKGSSVSRLREFSSTHPLVTKCCFNIRHKNCIAKESGTFEDGCGFTADFVLGENMMDGGACLAC